MSFVSSGLVGGKGVGDNNNSNPTPLSSLLDSESITTAATSKAVKQLNDKIKDLSQKFPEDSVKLPGNEKIIQASEDLSEVLSTGSNLKLLNGEFILTRRISTISNSISIEGQKDVVLNGNGTSIGLKNPRNITFKNIQFKNFSSIGMDNPEDIVFDNCKFLSFSTSGVNLSNYKNIKFINCEWDGIGSSIVNPAWHGSGIYAEVGDGLTIIEPKMTNIYGHGGIFLTSATNFKIIRPEIHDVAYRAINFWTGIQTGVIDRPLIYNCGSINTTGSGVGCNGIYSYYSSDVDLSGVSILYPIIKNVYENAIEGAFGLIESPVIDGTGIDPIGFPTPSTEGIWVEGRKDYSKIIRNPVLRNIHGSGIKSYSSVEIKKLHIYNTIVEESTPSLGTYAIELNSDTGYQDVLVDGVTSKNKTPLFFRTGKAYDDTYVNRVTSVNSGATLPIPAPGRLKVLDGFRSNLISNKDFLEWTAENTLVNWSTISTSISQVSNESVFIPKLTVASEGTEGGAFQILNFPKTANHYYLKINFTGNVNLKIQITPYLSNGNLDFPKSIFLTSSSFSETNVGELTFLYRITTPKARLRIGADSSVQGKHVVIQSIEERLFY